jgi:tetratricopeptide (TPR) repeat protein
MGIVYRAELPTGERVALKTVRGPTVATLASIRREILAMSQVQHEGIVRITDHGVDAGRPWYAMELLEGQTLCDLIQARFDRTHGAKSGLHSITKAGPFPAPLPKRSGADAKWIAAPPLGPILDVILQVCRPLASLHSNGIIHRDLKPANVFIEQGRAVLVDFGIAVRFGDSREYEIGDHGLAGTPEYMAPEQILGRNIDARADLYSVGCVLYECLTGRPPFVGETLNDVISQHLSSPPLAPSELVSGVPAALDRLVLRLLAKHPPDRPGFADDLATTLISLGADEQKRPQATGTRAYVYRPEFIGRQQMMRRLEGIILGHGSQERRALVRGESGLGKTRLLRELAANAAARDDVVVIAQCAGFGSSQRTDAPSLSGPLQPFSGFLTRLADLCRGAGPVERERLLGDRGGLLSMFEPSLAEFAPAEQREMSGSPDALRARLFAALRDTLYAFADGRRLLILIDDLQWADELTIGFIASLDDRVLEEHGTAIVCTYRTEDANDSLNGLQATPGLVLLSLPRLSATHVGDMVRGMLALRVAPPAFTEFVVQQSDGNPFFVGEYLRAAIDHGLLQRDPTDGWQLRTTDRSEDLGAAALPLPPSIRDLIDRRIGRLEAPARTLMEVASVLGREFDAELLQSVAGFEDGWALQVLRQRQIVEEGETGRLRFIHDRIRESAYDGLPSDTRANIHLRAARAIESIHPTDEGRGALLPTLAMHWSRAQVHDRAAACYALLGDRARTTYAHREALEYLDAAIEELKVLGRDGPREAASATDTIRRIEERRADILTTLGRHDAAREALGRASFQLPSTQRVWSARLLWKYARTLETEHRHAEALRMYDEAEQALGPTPPLAPASVDSGSHWPSELEEGTADGWWHQWVNLQVERVWVHYWLADVEAMTMRVDRVRSLIESHGGASQRARFFQALTHNNLRRERYAISEQTVSLAQTALTAAQETGDAAMIAYSQFLLGFLFVFSGRHGGAVQMLEAGLKGALRTGELAVQARCQTYLTVVHRMRGDLVSTREHALRSLEVAGKLAMDDYLGAAHANLGWIAWREQRHLEARRETDIALLHWNKIAFRYPYPFQWLARLHRIAAALDGHVLDEAISHANALLDTVQHRLPDAIFHPIEQATASHNVHERASIDGWLREALLASRGLGYL